MARQPIFNYSWKHTKDLRGTDRPFTRLKLTLDLYHIYRIYRTTFIIKISYCKNQNQMLTSVLLLQSTCFIC